MRVTASAMAAVAAANFFPRLGPEFTELSKIGRSTPSGSVSQPAVDQYLAR